MTPPESNKECEWWEEKPFRKPIGLSAIERGIDAKFSYDIPAIIENQHRISVQACMEVVKYNIRKYDGPDLEDRIIFALSEMKEKPGV